MAKHLERTHKTTYHALFDDVDGYHSGKRLPMLPMALQHQDFEASDPRDKLYALLGLVAEQNPGSIIADYGKPVQSVFTDFATAYLLSSRLDIFAGVSSQRMAGLPSWVPDW